MNTLSLSIADQIATVTLDRPQVKNAMSFEMMDELVIMGQELKETPDLRAVILTGRDGNFCSGLDTSAVMGGVNMSEIKETLSNLDPELGTRFQAPSLIWTQLNIPVIAALEGVCFGAGVQLALGADFRIAEPQTKLAILEAKWGLIPDMGLSKTLPPLMRADQAKHLIMTGDIIDATRAHKLGLVTALDETPLEAARTLARTLLQNAPEQIASAKQLVDQTWGTTGDLALEAALQSNLIGHPNMMAKAMASATKTPPKFT